MSKYDDWTREQLIEFIIELEKKRAFTYTDQLKLIILDKSPFTIWASDRKCIIRMWEGQCESMYGRKKEEVLGQDYVELFVARDERAAARRDQLEIIDRGKEFHNIANDQGRNGNTLQLITNCFRVRDPESGEYWNAEMGVAIDYYEEEKKQLERNIEEGRLIQTLISDFGEVQRQYREQFLDRKESLLSAIRTGQSEAVKKNRLAEYRERANAIKESIQHIEIALDQSISEYFSQIRTCTTSVSCAEIKTKFHSVLQKILDEFNDIVIDVEIINSEINNQSGIVTLKDDVMRETTSRNTRLDSLAYDIWLKAENVIDEYIHLGKNIDLSSPRLTNLKQKQERVREIQTNIVPTIADEIYSKLSNATTSALIENIRNEMISRYEEVEIELQQIRKELDS